MSTVNLKKLAVGMRTIEDLEMRLKFNIEKNGELIHITRNKPKRSEELCNGGSLFWIINRRVLVRQKILNIKQIIGDNNKFFAAILLENKIIKVRPTPMKPFQGWRYLKKNTITRQRRTDMYTRPCVYSFCMHMIFLILGGQIHDF